jgi:hypothetical protein
MKKIDRDQLNDAWNRVEGLTDEFRKICGRSRTGLLGPETTILMPESVFRKLGGEKEAEKRGYMFTYPGYAQVSMWRKNPT